jgi:hypothetical protein
MENKNSEDADIYDNLFGIKLKGLFNKENREARKESRTARKADRQANRPKDGTRFNNILSGLGSAAQTGAGIYSGLRSSKQSRSSPDQAQPPAQKNNSAYYIIGGVVALFIIIVVVIIATRK